MSNIKQKSSLVELGLTSDQALVYEALLEGGLMLGKNIVRKSGLKKGLVYKVLEQLIELELAEKKDRGTKAAMFSPSHPRTLQKFVDEKKEEVQNAQNSLDIAMTKMISQYNFLAGKPNVQMYEGLKGVKKVVFDSTSSKTEVLTIADNEAMNKYYPEINEENKKRRNKNKVFKKILSIDSEYIRKLAKKDNKETTERRILRKTKGLGTAIQIYDNKISYITLDPDRAIAVIIEDKALADTQRQIFMLLWQEAEVLR